MQRGHGGYGVQEVYGSERRTLHDDRICDLLDDVPASTSA